MSAINNGEPFLACDGAGLTRRQLDRALVSGELRRVFTGVLVDGSVPDSRDLRLGALRCVVPTDAFVGDHTAAWVWGADTRPPHLLRDTRPTPIARHCGTRPVPSRAIVRQSTIPDGDAVEMGGLLVTSPVRTTVDLLRMCWRPHALAAADSMVRAGAVDLRMVQEAVASLRRFPGIKQAHELAPRIDPRAESHGESWTRCRILDAGLPVPELNFAVEHRGRSFRLDGAYPESRVAVEYDGREFHSADIDIAHDGERRATLERHLSWRFVIATFERIFGEDDAFERELGELLNAPVRARSW